MLCERPPVSLSQWALAQLQLERQAQGEREFEGKKRERSIKKQEGWTTTGYYAGVLQLNVTEDQSVP